jgi:hypothetical protein
VLGRELAKKFFHSAVRVGRVGAIDGMIIVVSDVIELVLWWESESIVDTDESSGKCVLSVWFGLREAAWTLLKFLG